MGIVPENQYLLGLEGAGIIKRLGKNTSPYKIGQRVLVYEKGTFGNRIIATTERVYALPDSISFEVRHIRTFCGTLSYMVYRKLQPSLLLI